MRERLVILYGSQTGTAEDLAVRISYEAQRRQYECLLASMDEFGAGSLPRERFIMFVAATSGQGDPPDNMRVFWRMLRRRALPSDSLSHLQYGVIGLGDSSYAKFNFVGKRLQRRLAQLGAQSLLPTAALGDEQHDLGADAVVDPWLDEFWRRLDDLCPLAPGVQLAPVDSLPRARHTVSLVRQQDHEQLPKQQQETSDDSQRLCEGKFSAEDQLEANIEANQRVTAESHFQDVRLLCFSITPPSSSSTSSAALYSPGDVACVVPTNLREDVDQFLALVSFPDDLLVNIETGPLSTLVRSPCSFGWLVRHVLDIHSVPRRSFFLLLAHFSDSELEREKFAELGSAAGQQQLYDYCNRPRRTLLEVLADFPATAQRIPLEYLLEMIPAIRPRSFSIASAPETRHNCLELLVAVVRYNSKLVSARVGLCSTWLSRLNVGDRVSLSIKPGTIKFPSQDSVAPVVMVGPGTGVAPFRSFIDHRLLHQATTDAHLPQRHLVLFFGCRNQLGDFHFGDHFAELASKGQLSLFTAFSRDQPDKRYVQHVMREQAALLWQLMRHEGASIYVAGNSRGMPDEVRRVLVEIAALHGADGCDQEADGEAFVQLMENQGRLQMETWS